MFPAASSFALYPWRSISVFVNVHVLEKVCVAQILTCHCYLFFYFSRKYLQIVLPLSEMYLMPKAVCFFTLIVHLTDMVGKTGKTSYTQRMLLLLSMLGRAGKAFLTAALPSAFPKRVQIWIPTALNLELLPFLPLAAD